ncbi:MAG: LysR family transcriptional regulator [Bdellovibrionota bacterium]
MDIDRVRYFCVLAKTGSITKASEVLKISQPALSKAIKLLEIETGLHLTEREGRGLVLTEAGMRFLQTAEPLLHSWLTLSKDIQKPMVREHFRVGSFEVFTTYFLSVFLKSYPFRSLVLQEFVPGQLEQAIAQRRTDVGISYVPIPTPKVVFKEATKISMGVFGLKGSFDVKETDPPFVVPLAPLEGTPSKVVGLDGWPDHEFPRKFAYRVTLMQSAIEICSQGLALAYLPTFVVDLYNQKATPKYQLVQYQCAIPEKRRRQSVYIIHRQGEKEGPEVRAIAKALRSL